MGGEVKKLSLLLVLAMLLVACAQILGIRPPEKKPFPHHEHTAKAGITCLRCHAGILGATDTGPLHLPTTATCVGCHQKPHDTRECNGCHGLSYEREEAQIGAEGIGCEPASAVTLAGLKKLVADGRVGTEERAVLILTGHTLKDSDYTIKYHRGELLTDAEEAEASAQERAQDTQLRKPPVVLDANLDKILRTLDEQMAVAV